MGNVYSFTARFICKSGKKTIDIGGGDLQALKKRAFKEVTLYMDDCRIIIYDRMDKAIAEYYYNKKDHNITTLQLFMNKSLLLVIIVLKSIIEIY